MTATQTKIRRDTASNLAAATPAIGEPAFDTTNKRLSMGDGARQGGWWHANFQDVQNQTFLSNDAGGSSDAIEITCTPAPLAYVAYQRFVFKASAANTTTTPTIDVNSLGAKTIKKKSVTGLSALAVGDIQSGCIYAVVYDGTYMQIESLDAPPNAALLLLSTKTISAGATEVDFTSLITSSYSEYEWEFDDVRVTTDGSLLYMLTSSNNGTSFDTASSSYAWNCDNGQIGGTTSRQNSNLDTEIQLTGTTTIGNAAAEGISGTVKARSLLGTARQKAFNFEMTYQDVTGDTRQSIGAGARLSTSAINAVRFKPDAAKTFAGGKIRLFGRKA